MMHPLALLIVDDHPVYRDALSEKLGQELRASGVRVEAAGSASEGLEFVQEPARWVVMLDILMPGLSGLAGIRAFKAQPQVARVVAISGLDEKPWEARALSAGASMFISKNSTSEAICRKLLPLVQAAGDLQPGAVTPPEFRLTGRQREVLALVGKGHPNKIIASQLQISEQTVKIHINQIFKELRVFNRTQAVLKAQRHQLL